MRFMFIVKTAADQPLTPPTPALLKAMHELANREIKLTARFTTSAKLPDGSASRLTVMVTCTSPLPQRCP